MNMHPGAFERAKKTTKGTNMAALYGALADAQGEFPEIAKTKTGHGYKYADIADILRAVRPILSKNGLCLFQNIDGEQLVTTIAHSEGATLSVSYPLVTDSTGRMNNIQKVGAALTYARRYSLTALLGVAADEDIDAAEAQIPAAKSGTRDSGLRDAWKDGILDSLPEDASSDAKAKAFADAIMQEMQAKKSAKGLNGVWEKRNDIITYLDKAHNDMFQNVFDCFHAQMRTLQPEQAA